MKMSVGVTVGCRFTCAIRNWEATFKIWGGGSSSPSRGAKGGCNGGVDASGVEVHEGISDCLSCFQPVDKNSALIHVLFATGPSNLNLPITRTAFRPSSLCNPLYKVKYQAGSFATSARQASHNFPSVLAGCREPEIAREK